MCSNSVVFSKTNMATSHAISVVKSHCYTAPRISNTDRPATAKELSREQRKRSVRHKDEVIDWHNDVLTRNSSRTETDVGRYARHDQDSSLNYETQDAVSEEQFYQNLVKLKEEHKKSLKLLETKYYDELRNQNSFQWEGFSQGVGLKQRNGCEQGSSDGFELSSEPLRQYNSLKNDEERVFHKPPKSPMVRDVVKDMSHSTIASEGQQEDHSEDSDEREEMSGTDKDPKSPDEFSSSLFPKRSTAIDMVEDMWKDFSVRDYTTTNDETFEPHKSERPKEKEWSPVITVPKPFSMTLREATKEKRKTRSMKMIEEDIVLKKSMEEAELKKKFRAQPVPATTFLPLYDEIMVKTKRRSDHVREINKAILKATEKPFGFAKREEEKKRRKEMEERMTEERNARRDETKRAAFKARPPPKHMDDLSLADRLTEQDEYRKIRKKLRAAELLTKSRLPPSMEARANISPAAKSRQKCSQRNRAEGKATKPKFRPNINPDVPDFDALHWEFEKELRRKKKERQPTVMEPFNLHTARIPRGERSLRRTQSMENLTRSLDGTTQSKKLGRPLSARLSSSQDTLPFGTTESVRLRDNAVRKSLELRKQRDAQTSREMKERQKREKQLRSQVSVRAMANDHSWQLRKTSEGKLKSFRESDRGRQEEYDNEIAEMQRRVAQRPLLLEQESRANAKRKAERKYTQILRDAGVDEDLVSRLVTKEGNIADADEGEESENEESEDTSGDREHPNSWAVTNGADAGQDYLSEESWEGSEPEGGV